MKKTHSSAQGGDRIKKLLDIGKLLGLLAGIVSAAFVIYFLFFYHPPARNIVIVIDTSSVMAEPFGGISKMQAVKKALQTQVGAGGLGSMQSEDNVAIRWFGGPCEVSHPDSVTGLVRKFDVIGKDRSKINKQIEDIEIDPKAVPNMMQGVVKAIEDLSNHSRSIRKASQVAQRIADVQTDSVKKFTYQILLVTGSTSHNCEQRIYSITEALESVKNELIIEMIQYVAIKDEVREGFNSEEMKTLQEIADSSNGSISVVGNMDELMIAVGKKPELSKKFFRAKRAYYTWQDEDNDSTIKNFEECFDRGIVEASVYLGEIYLERWRDDSTKWSDWEKARDWYQKGAKKSTRAVTRLGRAYKKAGDVYRDLSKYEKAEEHYEIAKEKLRVAAEAFPAAKYYLAMLYLRDDPDKAEQMKKKAFDLGFRSDESLDKEWEKDKKQFAGRN